MLEEHHVDRGQLEWFYEDVLTPSFPSAELISRDEFLGSVADPSGGTCTMLAVDGSGEVIGGIVGEWFADCRVLLDSYLAVKPGRRGGGIGRRLIEESISRWSSRFVPLLIVGEVEDPRFHPATVYGDPVARLRFYADLGGTILSVPYFQPALREDLDRVRNLFLMVFASDMSCRSDSGVDSRVVRAFLEANLCACEESIDPDDAEVRALWEAVDHSDCVPLLDPEQFLN